MKKLILLTIIFIALLSSCNNDTSTSTKYICNTNYPFIIESVTKYSHETGERDSYGVKEKYRYSIKNFDNNFFSDSLYNVGDTLIISIKSK